MRTPRSGLVITALVAVSVATGAGVEPVEGSLFGSGTDTAHGRSFAAGQGQQPAPQQPHEGDFIIGEFVFASGEPSRRYLSAGQAAGTLQISGSFGRRQPAGASAGS